LRSNAVRADPFRLAEHRRVEAMAACFETLIANGVTNFLFDCDPAICLGAAGHIEAILARRLSTARDEW